jgi:rhodanese-related sulfurtransferase
MAAQHSPEFQKLCEAARSNIREVTVDQVKSKLDTKQKFHLIDVREESEWTKDHVTGAEYLGKGIIERDIEKKVPDKSAEIVLYCGGGYRSALAAENLQKMGYKNVLSMAGGIRTWREKNYPLSSQS